MSFKNIPFGSLDAFNVVIEIPKGSGNKYELDESLDVIRLDFIFSKNFVYPVDYGYIPETRGGDGDHLDALVLAPYPLAVGVVVESRPIGLIELLDRGEEDNKIIAVPLADPAAGKINSINDLPPTFTEELATAFNKVAQEKNKVIKILAFHDRERAVEELQKGRKHYQK